MKRKQGATEAKKHLGHGVVDNFSKSYTLNEFTDDYRIIDKHAYSMLQSFEFPFADIRGLGIHVAKLDNKNNASGKLLESRLLSSLLFLTISIANDQSKINFKLLPEHTTPAQPNRSGIEEMVSSFCLFVYKSSNT